MKLEKLISVFEKDYVNHGEFLDFELVKEYDISEIDISLIEKIIPANIDDPELYDAYTLDKKQLEAINALLPDKVIDIDEEKYMYTFGQFRV